MFKEGTKVLTKNGWKDISEVVKGDILLSFDKSSGNLVDSTVTGSNKYLKQLFSLHSKVYNLECSEHTTFNGWRRSKSRNRPSVNIETEFNIMELTQEHNALLAAKYSNKESNTVTVEDSELLGFILSDGSYSWSKKGDVTSSSFGTKKMVDMSLSQAEHKFWYQIELLLEHLQADYFKYEKVTGTKYNVNSYKFKSPWARAFLERVVGSRLDKHEENWVKYILALNDDNFNAWYNGFYLGDGTIKLNTISQNSGNLLDAVVAGMVRKGSGRVYVQNINEKCKDAHIHSRKHFTMQEVKRSSIGSAFVYDILVDHKYIVIWQGAFVGIVRTS